MKSGDVLLQVENISLSLGEKVVLRDLSLEIIDRQRDGKVTGQVASLLGPSGIGKTRLLRLLAGLDRADSGTILQHERQPLDFSQVGYVFQDYPLLAHRTVEGNLYLAGKVARLDEARTKQRATMLLERFHLADRRAAYPVELSGGERQRASIAQQLVAPKRFLLMDEPFSGLDPAALEDVCKLIVEAANVDDEHSVILVTHDIRAALLVSDTLFVLGRDLAVDGKRTAGARVQRKVDLVDMGLCWQPNLEDRPAFASLERELRAEFRQL